jgi:hypothetical protein
MRIEIAVRWPMKPRRTPRGFASSAALAASAATRRFEQLRLRDERALQWHIVALEHTADNLLDGGVQKVVPRVLEEGIHRRRKHVEALQLRVDLRRVEAHHHRKEFHNLELLKAKRLELLAGAHHALRGTARFQQRRKRVQSAKSARKQRRQRRRLLRGAVGGGRDRRRQRCGGRGRIVASGGGGGDGLAGHGGRDQWRRQLRHAGERRLVVGLLARGRLGGGARQQLDGDGETVQQRRAWRLLRQNVVKERRDDRLRLELTNERRRGDAAADADDVDERLRGILVHLGAVAAVKLAHQARNQVGLAQPVENAAALARLLARDHLEQQIHHRGIVQVFDEMNNHIVFLHVFDGLLCEGWVSERLPKNFLFSHGYFLLPR